MSRYLKALPASGATFTKKSTYATAGARTLTFGGAATTASVMVFGGGGRSCAEYITNPACCRNCCEQCCCSQIFHHSGAGGGYTEKLFSGVGGKTACIVVGAVEGTSSVCITSLGTITATGGTSTCLGTNGCSCTCTPRCTTPGCGSGGDYNTCGGLGMCRISSFITNGCNGGAGCCVATGFIALVGSSPGNTTANGCTPALVNTQAICRICSVRQYNPGPYGSCPSNLCRNESLCVFSDLPRAYGACPVESDKFYSFNWDTVGGSSVATGGNPSASSLTATTTCSLICNTSGLCGNICFNTIAVPATYPTGVGGGLTGGGGIGGVGGAGGGGGGVFISEIPRRCICTDACVEGGPGLVVVYYS